LTSLVPTPLQDQPAPRRLLGRIARHVHWARDQGVGRLIEEDQLNPLERVPLAIRKRRWRRAHSVAPNAVPVFVVGVQRSGTNMLVRGLERSPEVEVRNENDGEAFDRFQLRSDPVVRRIVERSGHRYVLFKPLCDSHRIADILDALGTPSPGRAIWAYRDVRGRVRSAVQKFGPANLDALRRIASGAGEGMWQSGGLGPEKLELIRGFDYERMSPESASALFWYLRNSLFFDLGLDRRDDIILASYHAMVGEPERAMRALCGALGFAYQPALIAHIDARSTRVAPSLDLDSRIATLCDDLEERLDSLYERRLA
jgi:hypothetical protein